MTDKISPASFWIKTFLHFNVIGPLVPVVMVLDNFGLLPDVVQFISQAFDDSDPLKEADND